MKLKDVLQNISPIASPTLELNPDISDLCYDSRKVKPGMLFFAIPGFAEDGTKYVPAALNAGALLCVVEKLESIEEKYHKKCLVVKNVREALAISSANFFGNPSEKMLTIGITGTKGKTSTSFLVEAIFAASGKKTALLGTVECHYPGKKIKSERTTMESYELQKFLCEAVDHGAEVAVLEVSSHALSLARVFACKFDGMLFTNLMEDHLDFYGDMENYFSSKKILFTAFNDPKSGKMPVAVANKDNPYGERLLKESETGIVSYGEKNASYGVESVDIRPDGMRAIFSMPSGQKIPLQSKLTGRFNLSNIIGAMALACELGIDPAAISRGIANMESVPGRLERIATSLPFQVFVDYAHMGDALENVLSTLRPVCKGRLIVLFGAGGDRPPDRRTQLGAVSARLADFAVITSDNPRTEDPQKIIEAIEKSFQAELAKHSNLKHSYEIVPDRTLAIRRALSIAQAGDVVCLAGKGHESGQIIGTQEIPFDDREEARKVLREIEVDSTLKT